MFVAWSFPGFGAMAYLCFGINRLPAKGWKKYQADEALRERRESVAEIADLPLVYWAGLHRKDEPSLSGRLAQELNDTMDALLAEFPLLGGNRVELLVTGDEAYPAMLAAIQQAKHHIHLQSFIISRDAVGRQVMDALAAKAREGVRVRVLYDHFGSTYGVLSGFFRSYGDVPNFSLVAWTQSNPVRRLFSINLRNHRKMLIVDGRQAFVGGINLSRENVKRPGHPAIRDFHFSVEGPAVQELQYSFVKDWHFMTDETPETLLQKEHFPTIEAAGPALVRVVNSGPTTAEMGIVADVFFASIVAARHRVLVVTPYFVPTQDILQALRMAALRGVSVQLVVPERNNHTYAGLAGQALFEGLLQAGVEIYQRRPPFIHAKSLIVDDVMALVGTANFDERSLHLNYETNLAVYDEALIAQLRQAVRQEIRHSRKLDLREWQARSLRLRLLENFCHLLTPVL
jgi:cardiolipin synthase